MRPNDSSMSTFSACSAFAGKCCRSCAPGNGYVVNIGSIGGLIQPYQALYSASKFALEGMSESLRMEVRPFGINVVLNEPGDANRDITRNRGVTADVARNQIYGSFPAALERTASDEKNGPGPENIARLLWKIVNTPSPRLRYTVGPAVQRVAVWLKRLLPNGVLEYGMRRYYGLDR